MKPAKPKFGKNRAALRGEKKRGSRGTSAGRGDRRPGFAQNKPKGGDGSVPF